jgi:hypothetical protein
MHDQIRIGVCLCVVTACHQVSKLCSHDLVLCLAESVYVLRSCVNYNLEWEVYDEEGIKKDVVVDYLRV